MKDDKKAVNSTEEVEEEELDLGDLDQVTGGSIRNVRTTKTVDITDDMKKKI